MHWEWMRALSNAIGLRSVGEHADAASARPRKRPTAPPFRFGWTTVWPGTYLNYIPDRYWAFVGKYRGRAGVGSRLQVADFVRGSERNNCGDLARYYTFCLAFDQIVKEKLDGDLAELGVYKGNTGSLLAAMARQLGRTAYLLDTYQGFAEKDVTGIDAAQQVSSFADTSVAAVRARVGEANVRFIRGYFPETASQLPENGAYCLVHLDCDLYAPLHAALRYFYPRLVRGGFLIMHDYASLAWEGAEQAIDQFFADKPEKVVPIPDKSGTAIIRKV